MKKILYLINGLKIGGAETNLHQIVKHSNKTLFSNTVISLTGTGYFEGELKKAGANVILLDVKKHPFSSYFKLKRIAKDYDVISCWMYHANAIGYLVTKHLKNIKIIWNIRHSNISKEHEKRFTFLLNKFCSKRSKKVDLIVYNGVESKKAHEAFGYSSDNSIVLNNGCDIDFFDGVINNDLRNQFHLDSNIPIIISVGRNHPVKDPETFIATLSYLKQKRFCFKAFMCGMKYDNFSKTIIDLCSKHNIIIGKDLFLLGLRTDINKLLAGSDFFVLHSISEAFPNVLIQAMASRCICISTNVGDARTILNNDSFVVDLKDSKKIGDIIINIWNLPKEQIQLLKEANRQRVALFYNIETIAKEYESIL